MRPTRDLGIFRSLGVLRTLNVAAVGLSLSAATSAALRFTFSDHSFGFTAAVAAPTLLLGALWAALLRSKKTVGKSTFRMGWAASVPLAMANAGIAAGLSLSGPRFNVGSVLGMAVLGATFGAIVWIPALVATLICFGLPIAWAQKLSSKGLAGQERGEWLVGLATVVIAALSVPVALRTSADDGRIIPLVMALLAVLTGGAATGLSFLREARRRRFVTEAATGRIPGYRVDATDEGKVLIRIETQGQGYRVADVEEELFDLDAEGAATHPRRAVAELSG